MFEAPQTSENRRRPSASADYRERQPSRLASCYTREERKLLTQDFRDDAVRALCMDTCLGAFAGSQQGRGKQFYFRLTHRRFLKRKRKPVSILDGTDDAGDARIDARSVAKAGDLL